MVTVPARLDDVDHHWLTDALRTAGALRGDVVGSRLTPVGQDLGFIGMLGRFDLDVKGDGDAPSSVIVKVPTADPTNLLTGQLLDAYRRELGFYRDIVDAPLRTPYCYLAAADETTGATVLVLEDLGTWDQPDQTVGVDAETAARLLGTVATLHARFWAQDDELSAYDWLAPWDGPYCRGLGDLVRGSLDAFTARWGGDLSATDADIISRVARDWERVIDESLGAERLTMQHGDFRLDNLFVRGDEIAVADWGNTMRTGPGYDLAYFIAGSLDAEVCASESEALVEVWRDALDSAGVRVTSTQARRFFRGGLAVGLGAFVIIGGALDLGDDRGAKIMERSVTNVLALVHAHGVVDEFGL